MTEPPAVSTRDGSDREYSITLDFSYTCVMAHHALRHIVELEHVIDAIAAGLVDRGVFVSFNMIGRNGHMR